MGASMNSSDSKILTELFSDDCLLEVKKRKGKFVVELKDEKVKNVQTEVVNVPADTYVIDLDSHFDNALLIKGNLGANKRADFIFISPSKEQVLFIEMKTRKAVKEKDVVKQLKGAKCVFEYCQSLAAEFWQKPRFLANYQQRYILLNNHIGKRPTKVKTDVSIHSSPKNLVKLNASKQIQFNLLAGISQQ